MKYIIHKTNFAVLSVENPNEMQENGYSNFDNIWLNIPQSDRNANYCFQETLPSADKIYWKLENGQIVEMTTEEKAQKDQEILTQLQAQQAQQEKDALRQDALFGSELSAKFMLEFNFTSIEQSIVMDDKLFNVNRNLLQGMLQTALARLQEVPADELFTEQIKTKYIGLILNYLTNK